MDDIHVDILQGHIDRGRKGPCTCPVALALRDKGYPEASVGTETAFVRDDGDKWCLDQSARQFITNFDRRLSVSPISISLSRVGP